MGLSFSNGTITTSASEQNIFDITANAHHASYIFTHNMQTGDTVVIKIYIKDDYSSTVRLFDSVTLSGAQTLPSYFIPFLPATQFRVSIQRTAGTDRAYTYLRIEVT